VEIDRHIQFGGRLPERVVIVGAERQVLRRDLPDQAADHAGFLAALELLDGVLDVVE
jgi:hypothetical protein